MDSKAKAAMVKLIRELPRYEPSLDSGWDDEGPCNCTAEMSMHFKGSWVDISMVLELVRNLKVTPK